MKILFVDIFGTITQSRDGSKFTPENDPTAIELIPGVEAAIARHCKYPNLIIGISNQGGINAGDRSFESVIEEMQHVLHLVPLIDYICICPDFMGLEFWSIHRSGVERRDQVYGHLKGQFRKPNPGMINATIEAISSSFRGVDLEFSMVGDRHEDRDAAIAADIPFQWAYEWRDGTGPS